MFIKTLALKTEICKVWFHVLQMSSVFLFFYFSSISLLCIKCENVFRSSEIRENQILICTNFEILLGRYVCMVQFWRPLPQAWSLSKGNHWQVLVSFSLCLTPLIAKVKAFQLIQKCLHVRPRVQDTFSNAAWQKFRPNSVSVGPHMGQDAVPLSTSLY